MPARKPRDPNANTDWDDQAKIDRFKALARELGCDADETAFEAALKALATSGTVPKHEPKKRQPKE